MTVIHRPIYKAKKPFKCECCGAWRLQGEKRIVFVTFNYSSYGQLVYGACCRNPEQPEKEAVQQENNRIMRVVVDALKGKKPGVEVPLLVQSNKNGD